jgi:hypothetical protein
MTMPNANFAMLLRGGTSDPACASLPRAGARARAGAYTGARRVRVGSGGGRCGRVRARACAGAWVPAWACVRRRASGRVGARVHGRAHAWASAGAGSGRAASVSCGMPGLRLASCLPVACLLWRLVPVLQDRSLTGHLSVRNCRGRQGQVPSSATAGRHKPQPPAGTSDRRHPMNGS